MKNCVGTIALLVMGFISHFAIAQEEAQGRTYTLFAGGDMNLARWVSQEVYDHGPVWPLEEVIQLSREADIAFTNLECVLATGGSFFHKGERRPYLYRGRPEMIDVLTEAGFDVVAVANNHAMDFGPEALLEQDEMLRAVGIAPAGAGKTREEAATPAYVRVGDLIVAFIGMETEFPLFSATRDRAGVFHGKGPQQIKKRLLKVIKAARQHADLVIFTPHWGRNFTDNTTPARRKLATWIIDQGVDAILGHSAHHLHGVEIHRGKPIVYDMGTYLFDRVKQNRMSYSAGFELAFDAEGFKKLVIHPVRAGRSRTRFATWKEAHRIHRIIRRTSKALNPDISFQQVGKSLVLEMNPETPAVPRKDDPEAVFQSGQSVQLPDKYRYRVSDVVVDRPPEWTEPFTPIDYQHGITVLGGRSSDAARPGRAFMAEVALRVSGPIPDAWMSLTRMVRRGESGRFTWTHPIADAAWNPKLWQKGQIVIDRTLVRPKGVKPGTWDLYWGMARIKPRRKGLLKILNPLPNHDRHFVRFDEILISSEGVPRGPAGVAWDGWLPGSPDFDPERFAKALSGNKTVATIVFFSSVVGLALLVIMAGFILRKARRSD